MISQEHSSIQINLMFSKFKADVNQHKNPNEIVMDQSSALLLSAVTTFTSCTSVNEYLDHCFDALFKNKKPPQTYIRLDRSHIVKSILQKSEFRKGISNETSMFYKRLLGYIIQLDDIRLVTSIMQNMFTLMHSRYLFHDENIDVANIKSKLVETSNQHKIIDDMNVTYQLSDIEVFENSSNTFAAWITAMTESIRVEYFDLNCSDHEVAMNFDVNPYYAPTIVKAVAGFLSKLPLSGCIMNKHFGSSIISPTSSATETDFGVIKNDLFHRKSRIRIDSWLSLHLKFLKGRVAGMKANELRKYMSTLDTSDLFNVSDMSENNNTVERNVETNNDDCYESDETHTSDGKKESISDNLSSSIDADNTDSHDSFDEKMDKYENFKNQNEDGKLK